MGYIIDVARVEVDLSPYAGSRYVYEKARFHFCDECFSTELIFTPIKTKRAVNVDPSWPRLALKLSALLPLPATVLTFVAFLLVVPNLARWFIYEDGPKLLLFCGWSFAFIPVFILLLWVAARLQAQTSHLVAVAPAKVICKRCSSVWNLSAHKERTIEDIPDGAGIVARARPDFLLKF